MPCSIAFNDTIIPYSGYNVSLLSSSGNAYPGWPQAWQLNGGLNGTVNISNGAPLWNGTIIYPQPILSQPLNHGPQSISGLVNMTGYNLIEHGRASGVGTVTPAWPWMWRTATSTARWATWSTGARAPAGQCLVSNGNYFGPGSCGTLPTVYYQHVQVERIDSCRRSLTQLHPAVRRGQQSRGDTHRCRPAVTAVTPGLYQPEYHGRCLWPGDRGYQRDCDPCDSGAGDQLGDLHYGKYGFLDLQHQRYVAERVCE